MPRSLWRMAVRPPRGAALWISSFGNVSVRGPSLSPRTLLIASRESSYGRPSLSHSLRARRSLARSVAVELRVSQGDQLTDGSAASARWAVGQNCIRIHNDRMQASRIAALWRRERRRHLLRRQTAYSAAAAIGAGAPDVTASRKLGEKDGLLGLRGLRLRSLTWPKPRIFSGRSPRADREAWFCGVRRGDHSSRSPRSRAISWRSVLALVRCSRTGRARVPRRNLSFASTRKACSIHGPKLIFLGTPVAGSVCARAAAARDGTRSAGSRPRRSCATCFSNAPSV